MTYDFSLDRKATVTLGAGSMLLLILVFVAGVLTGLTWRSDQELMMTARPASPSMMKTVAAHPAAAAPPNPAPAPIGKKAPASAPETPAPAATAPAAPPAATMPAAPAAAEPKTPDVPGIQLAIQVGAFLERANADKLVARLKEEGYAPQIVASNHGDRQWNFVRVGPYHDWEEATEVAAVLSRDQASPAVVRPMR